MAIRPEDWPRVREVFEAALAVPATERRAYVIAACGGDGALCGAVEQLVASHDSASRFLETPPDLPSELASQPLPLEGRRLGAYEVVSRIGAGGMGEVYRARDTKLGRDVAIKILPPIFTADPDRLARFDREARVLAALNHPNIAAIYGVEDPAEGAALVGTRALVLELVEGDTLAERIARTTRESGAGARPGLPLAEAVKLATQIADALEAAHERGIVHRDLKPANIKITPAGLVKVLDFGLAKAALGDDATPPDLSNSPTITIGGTRPGLILGTAAYMSPEQARGQVVDKRTDIWAFGCVLYEMVAGRVAFPGATLSDTVAAILEREPDWAALPAATPPSVRHLLQRCLEKDARQRLRDIGEARIELLRSVSGLDPIRVEPGRRPRMPAPRFAIWAAAAGALALAAAASLVWMQRQGAPPSTSAAPQESQRAPLRRLTADTGLSTHPALAPGGRLVAFASDRAGDGNLDIWVQQAAGGDAIRLTRHAADETTPGFSPDGTQIAFRSERDGGGAYVVSALGGEPTLLAPKAYNPRFSPDGRWLAYQTGRPGAALDGMLMFGGGRLYVMPATGGAPEQLHADAAAIDLGVWSPDSEHLLTRASFASGVEPREWWVLPRDGRPRQVDVQLLGNRGMNELFPIAWLPGNRVVFTARLGDSRNTWIASLSTDWKIVAPLQQVTHGAGIDSGGSVVAGASGTFALVFANIVQNVDLWSVPLTRDRLQVAGPPERLTHDVFMDRQPALTSDGAILVYRTDRASGGDIWARDLTSGRTTRVVSMAPTQVGKPVLSRDGSRLAFWTVDIPPAQDGGTNATLDGRTNATFVTELRRAADGTLLTGTLRQLTALAPEGSGWPWSWTPDGRAVWYDTARWPRHGPNHLYDVVTGERIGAFQHADRDLSHLVVSPDGRWLAFSDPVSEDTMRLVVTPVVNGTPAGEARWIPLTETDVDVRWPAWSPAGDAIFFSSTRDGFVCLWGQRVDMETMRPVGSPLAVYHSHAAQLSIGVIGPNQRGLAVARDRVVFNMSEMTGSIWMAEFADDALNARK